MAGCAGGAASVVAGYGFDTVKVDKYKIGALLFRCYAARGYVGKSITLYPLASIS